MEDIKKYFPKLLGKSEDYIINKENINLKKLSLEYKDSLSVDNVKDILDNQNTLHLALSDVEVNFKLEQDAIKYVLDNYSSTFNDYVISCMQPLSEDIILEYIDKERLRSDLLLISQPCLVKNKDLVEKLKEKLDKDIADDCIRSNVFLSSERYKGNWIKVFGNRLDNGQLYKINSKLIDLITQYPFFPITEAYINLDDPIHLCNNTYNYHIIREYYKEDNVLKWKIK